MTPSARQVAVHEALVRHGGSYAAAGRELGISGTAVRITSDRYLEATGEAPPERLRAVREPRAPRPPRLSRAEVVSMLPDRIAAQVDRFLDRQPLVLEVRPQHRRQADGGAGGRAETRTVARGLRKVAGV